MALHLVRHARAGSRGRWSQPDELRPLTEAGALQADVIATHLADEGVKRVLSSRFLRCTQTVLPLAQRLGLELEVHEALSEEAELPATWALLEDLARQGLPAVVCSHGNVIPPLLDRLHRRGVDLVAEEWSCKKGSVWTLDVDDDGSFVRARLTLPQA